MTTHTVLSTKDTVRSGYLDPTAPPVAVITSGDEVSYPHTWTHWGNEAVFGMTFADREPLRHRYPHGPYSMLGPVEVSELGLAISWSAPLWHFAHLTGDGTLSRLESVLYPPTSKSHMCITSASIMHERQPSS